MKKLILSAGAMLMMCAAFAQTPQQAAPTTGAPMQAPQGATPEQQAERRAQNLAQRLQLTPEQQAKVKTVFTEQMTKMDAARKDNGGDQTKMRDAVKNIREEADKKLKGILTPEQWTKYQETMPHHPPMPGAPAQVPAPKN